MVSSEFRTGVVRNKMSEKGYCKWCDTQTNAIVKLQDEGRLVWVGCPDCYAKKKELENNAFKK